MESQQGQAIFDTKHVAEHFEIHSSTVRKYCDYLEKAGYSFHKNEYGHRGFFDDDLIALRKLIQYKDTMTLEQASKTVVAWKKGNSIAGVATEKKRYSTEYSELLEEFRDFKENQIELNRELIDQIKKQQEYIENLLEERDQRLVIALKESMAAQKLIAVSSQESKKWWEFWKRKD